VQYPVPLPLLEAYARFNHRPEDFPIASTLTTRILSLPLYPELTVSQQREVVAALAAEVARTNRLLANA
jgi:dTDP-4-amino-4,6-dideoxygalactose transaminase